MTFSEEKQMNRRNMICFATVAALSLSLATPPVRSLAQEQELAGGPIVATGVIWEECREKKIFGEKVKGCARLLEENGKFYLELEVAAKRRKWEIASKCFESDKISVGVVEAWLKVCLSDIKVEANKLRGVKVTYYICGKAIGQSDCWKVYEDTLSFFYVDAGSVSPAGYVTASDKADAIKQ